MGGGRLEGRSLRAGSGSARHNAPTGGRASLPLPRCLSRRCRPAAESARARGRRCLPPAARHSKTALGLGSRRRPLGRSRDSRSRMRLASWSVSSVRPWLQVRDGSSGEFGPPGPRWAFGWRSKTSSMKHLILGRIDPKTPQREVKNNIRGF